MGEMVRIRNRVFRLLERTQRPDQQKDLMFLAGALCGLLASTTFDLGYPDAAIEQARSAWTYGHVIGYTELCAWAKGTQATVAFWSGRPREAIDLVDQVMVDAPAGTTRVRLCCISARAWAALGDIDRVNRAVRHAIREREVSSHKGEMHDEIGGQFGFAAAREAFCTGSAYLQAGVTDTAIHASRQAITSYQGRPMEERSYMAEFGARADLAAAYLLQQKLDRAHETLEAVLVLAPEQRVAGLVRRVGRVRRLLKEPPYHDSEAAQEIVTHIDKFTAETTVGAPSGGFGFPETRGAWPYDSGSPG